MKEYLRKKDVAILFSVTKRSIDNWMSRGIIPYLKLGKTVLFDREKVIEAIGKFEKNGM